MKAKMWERKLRFV